MDVQKKLDRATLKSYFVRNAIPTAANFSDLIDGLINQKDDGIAKSAGEPLSLQADVSDTSLKKVINFYKNFADPQPAWTLSLNPRVDLAKAETAKPGWSIGDADGNSKLFIDQTTCNIGVGTVEPGAYKLNVNGPVLASGKLYVIDQNQDANGGALLLGPGTQSNLRLGYHADYSWIQSHGGKPLSINPLGNNVGIGTTTPFGKLDVNGVVRAGSTFPATKDPDSGMSNGGSLLIKSNAPQIDFIDTDHNDWSIHVNSNKMYFIRQPWNFSDLVLDGAGNVGIGTDGPKAKLEVRDGAIMPAAGNSSTAGIQFPSDPGGGGGDTAWIRYYARQGEACTLEIGVSNDADDHIALISSGNVGIGTTGPVNKLDVMGDIAVQNKHAIRGNDTWLRLNQDLKFTAGVHTPGLFAPMSLNVGGVNGWGNPGNGNVVVSGGIACGGKIWIRTYHPNCKYLGVRPEGSVYAGNNKDIWESFTLEMGCSRDIKENICTLSDEEAMVTLQRLTPVKYDYKGERLFRQNLGFIAEDMPDNLASENRKTLSPFEITPVLTRVAQEQQKMLVALQEKIDRLEEGVRRQQAQIGELRAEG